MTVDLVSLCTDDPTLLDRIGSKVTIGDGCWIWTGSHNGRYGQIRRRNGGTRVVHRIMYELLVGPIPDGMELDHLCRNTFCVRPDHLDPVTHSVNIRRGDAPAAQRRRHAAITHCPQGHPYDEENTIRSFVPEKGCVKRKCLACRRERDRRRHRARTS